MSHVKLASDRYSESTMAFRDIELLKKETLGTGSYGAVFKARYDQLICAAKIMYPVLFNIRSENSKDHKLPFRRFESECHFLSHVQHPNIVQYLGTYCDPETNAPVLLMELMDESLTSFLESSPGDLPYHTQINLSYDIAQALAFLHSNDIVHRDLSSNNVLLLAGRAKIADFGMSKFETNLATMTMCPGTAVYMSPEALNTPPVYTEKLDVFSLGVLMLQIMTRTFPHPTSRLATKEVIDPTNHGKIIEALVIVPEGQRRIAQLTRVDCTHPLLPIAQQCMKDIDTIRPSAADMCGILTCVRESSKYKTSATRQQDGLKENRRKENEEMQQMKQELQETTEKLKNAQKAIQKLTRESSEERSLWRRQGNYLVHTLSVGNNATDSEPLAERPTRHSAGTSSPCISSPTSPLFPPRPNTGDWKLLPDCPITVHAGSSTVVGSKAYFQNKESGAIVEYDSTNRLWSLTPFHTLKQCGLACFENTLITVGGYDDQSKTSNKLFSLVDKKWKEILPSMSTPRDGPTVVSTDTSIIVAGGKNKFQMPLKTVEVFGVSSKQWMTAKPLPFPLYQASATVHDGYVYMTAGEEGYNQRAVIRISIDALHTRENVYANTSSLRRSNLEVQQQSWESVCDLPVQYSTLADVNGHLLALGGSNPPKINPPSALVHGTQAVYEYSPAQNTWRAVSHMTIGRYRCLAAVLPGRNIIVVGGVSPGHERAKCTEYMTMND